MTNPLPLKNDRLLRALCRQPVDMTPVWIMRQAGRYLPEYRAIRAKAGNFMTLCKTPELACEVTLQPLRRYAFDAAILFSDILTIPDAMGLQLSFSEGNGPRFAYPIRQESDITKWGEADLERLSYVYETIQLVQKELAGQLPLIGFCGSPWTLAAYMIEGQAKPGFPLAQKMRIERPLLLHKLLDTLTKSISAHLNAQIKAGVQVIMLFDTWGGLLDTQSYETFSLSYLRQIIADLNGNKHYTSNGSNIPIILFTKTGHGWLEQMADSGCCCLGVDWEISLREARARVGNKVALQGNMNPASLLKSPEEIRNEVGALLDSFGPGSGHIFNLGHGITPDIPPEHVGVLVEAVHELSLERNKVKNTREGSL